MALQFTALNAKDAFEQYKTLAGNIGRLCPSISGPASVPANLLASLLAQVNGLLAFQGQVIAVTGLVPLVVAYAQTLLPSTTVQADFNTALTALQTLQGAIIKDYPVDSTGHVLDRVIDANGNITWANFTPAQLPNTIPAITAWLATV